VVLLGCVLLQLSPYIRNEEKNLEVLKGLLDAVSPGEYNYAVEFRHRSWLNENRDDVEAAVLDVLRERNVANVLLDGPGSRLCRKLQIFITIK